MASVIVHVFQFVSLHDTTKMTETKNHQTWHRGRPSRVFTYQLILGQKVKGQGHRVTKCKKATEWQASLCTLLSAQPLV